MQQSRPENKLKRPIRKKLKQSANDYLRQRLQVRPADVHKMIRAHSRLSTVSLKYIEISMIFS